MSGKKKPKRSFKPKTNQEKIKDEVKDNYEGQAAIRGTIENKNKKVKERKRKDQNLIKTSGIFDSDTFQGKSSGWGSARGSDGKSGGNFQIKAPMVKQEREKFTREDKIKEETETKEVLDKLVDNKFILLDPALVSDPDLDPMKVGLRNHEIDKMRGDLEHIPENEDEFIEALMQGNSDKIFLLQLSDVPLVPPCVDEEDYNPNEERYLGDVIHDAFAQTAHLNCGDVKMEFNSEMDENGNLDENDRAQLINDPPQRAENSHATTNVETLMHLFKGNVGTGLLSLPLAIYHGGWIFGPLMLVFISLMAVHCMHLLVGASQHLCRKLSLQSLDYGEVMSTVLQEYGPRWIRHRSHIGSKLVNLFILITQFGFCCCYFVFIAANIREVALEYTNSETLKNLLQDGTNADRVIMAIMAIPICAICSIRNLDHLAPFSAVANLATAVSVAIIFSYLIPNLNDPIKEDYPKIQSFSYFALFFGTAVFSFEGISVVLPLENNAKNPEDFPSVLNAGMVLVTVLYLSMGVLGYLTFGENICGSVTLNLPNETIYASVKILYCFVIFISFAVQFYVPITFLWPSCRDKFCVNSDRQVLFELIFRYSLVLAVCGLAIVIPDLGDIISLIGAMASSMLALILPPLMDQLIKVHNRPGKMWYWIMVTTKNAVIVAFGVLGMVVGTVVSIDQLITDLSGSNTTQCVPANLTDMSNHLWFSSVGTPTRNLIEL